MQRGLVGSEMCIRDRYQRRVHGADGVEQEYEGDFEEEEGSEVEPEGEQESEEEGQVLTKEEVEYIISSFPSHKYIPGKQKSDTCSICLEKFKKNDIVKTIPCAHIFHRRCIDAWLPTNLSCPLCRCPIIS
eukprot:TRINITY_DN13875_c0_g1_i1.p2 TRINITY_DN13875_c0_g1~~TRINITY_DN13875_c0_g1_i1.p2  ORF type:complete len:131 (-),score=45.79 TRINITY_DN13875_c0_g1_i1:220-612(-)